jgi:hypothetical protein
MTVPRPSAVYEAPGSGCAAACILTSYGRLDRYRRHLRISFR